MLRVEGLSKRYGALTAVRDLSFSIRPGEILGLLGPNGSGKSTTVKIITGLLRPTRGIVTLDPDAPGEIHGPLDFAPLPGSMARRLFEPTVIEAHLDHLAGAQREDGGWTFNWMAWSPAAAADWRGFLTVENLRILRANGRG